MFRLPPCEAGDDETEELVRLMERCKNSSTDNTRVPAGFTYLGQFIDHDITFDPTSDLEKRNDPQALVNFRTPRYDLDSVYGSGPRAQPYLYDWEDSGPSGTKLLVGHNAFDATDDLPRNQQGRALIGDARNDENVIVAQLHLLFIRFHNAVVDHLSGKRVPDSELFEEAQRMARWHYQWIVVHEFLPKVVGTTMANSVLAPAAAGKAPAVRRKYFKWRREPFIPVEFSGAAYRFGHSMVRDRYGVRVRREGEPAEPGIPILPGLAGFTWLRRRLVIDWERFFEFPDDAVPFPQFSFRVDTAIVEPLFHLPGKEALPRLNLRRGSALGLPSGQRIARAMKEPLLTETELLLDDQVQQEARKVLLRATPLWYYILCEASRALDEEGRSDPGSHLGPVGGRIVAEVLVGLLEGDPSSYLAEEPGWRPTLGTDNEFGMADLVRIAQGSLAANS